MSLYLVHGGKPLKGEVDISGAKNAALGIIPMWLPRPTAPAIGS